MCFIYKKHLFSPNEGIRTPMYPLTFQSGRNRRVYIRFFRICYNYIMLCLECKCETKNPKFCSTSCAAKYNNRNGTYKRKTLQGTCKSCSTAISSARTYCKECYSNNAVHTLKIPGWLDGSWRGGTDAGLSKIIRNYLLKKENYSCQRCSFNVMHPDDGKTILEINHINGDGTDHSPENLEVICPNCHALTSSYRARNMGKGRPVYYLRKFH